MRSLLLLVALFVAAAGQQPTMPPPGNPEHVEPPPGMNCVHAGPGVKPEQACACHPVCMENREPNGDPNGTFTRQEDVATCRASCHPKHCSCLSDCETS